MIVIPEDAKYDHGDRVIKKSGDYTFTGIIVSVFWKRSGVARYVVENDAGILHIFNEKNLEKENPNQGTDFPAITG